jgi:murein L,D-transpeptidase YcbB/YkuD
MRPHPSRHARLAPLSSWPLVLVLCCALIGATATVQAADEALSQLLRARLEQPHDPRANVSNLGYPNMSEAVSEFYELRQFTPAWTENATVDALLRELDAIREDGLDPEDYHLAELHLRYAQRQTGPSDTAAQADFELLASQSYLRALAHLFRGKVNPATLDTQWNFALRDISTGAAFDIVNAAVETGNIGSAFDRARPQHPVYRKARQALATLRAIDADGGWPQLTTTTTLKPGMDDAQVTLLRRRLARVGYLPEDRTASTLYDDELSAVVRTYQREQYLDVDAAIGPATRAALNESAQARIEQARVNLERGRWLLHDIADNTVVVDVAGFKVYYLRQGKRIWEANVQVGKPFRSTPIFRSDINRVTFNPTWTVPPTIYRQDLLPKIRRDPTYLATHNMRVLNTAGREINPASVNWNNPSGVVLRADAGPDNPLGRLVIRFPNPYSVYLHDTPSQALFGSSQRAFSSGCIRVERPRELVELLFNDSQQWNRAAIDAQIAEGSTKNIIIATPVPLLIAYWTMDVLESQRIVFKPDIYKRDPPLLAALNKRL